MKAMLSVPQIRAMFGGDHSRKQTLVEYGFRLPAALDNRPMRMEEFESLTGQTIFVSATPADYELEKSEGVFVDQVIRPTGLLDPPIDVRPSLNQIDDLMAEIRSRTKAGERTLVTTITKRMAEELSAYLLRYDIKCRYIHSDIDTLERIDIMEGLRTGAFDVLVGVNLLREGLGSCLKYHLLQYSMLIRKDSFVQQDLLPRLQEGQHVTLMAR